MFSKYCGLTLVQEAIQEAEIEIATESWEILMFDVIGNIPGHYIGKHITDSTLRDIMSNKKLQAYIDDACKKVYAQVVKKYGSKYKIDKNIEAFKLPDKSQGSEIDADNSPLINDLADFAFNNVHQFTVKNWNIYVYCDTTHIHRICCALAAYDKEIGKYRMIIKSLPSPTKKEIKDLGYKEEYDF